MKMEQTECSETSAYKIQTPGNYPEVFVRVKVWLEPNFYPYKYSNIHKPSHSSYLPAYEDGKECSETSAYKIQRPGNHP